MELQKYNSFTNRISKSLTQNHAEHNQFFVTTLLYLPIFKFNQFNYRNLFITFEEQSSTRSDNNDQVNIQNLNKNKIFQKIELYRLSLSISQDQQLMNVTKTESAKQQGQGVNRGRNYCPLLHIVTLMATFQAKRIPSLQGKIDQAISDIENMNINEISESSFMVLIEAYYSHLGGSQNVRKLIEILCSKINKNTQTQILIDLFEILAKQYNLRGQKDQEIRVLYEAFYLGLGMKKRVYKTFSFGVRACELMSLGDFQKNINNAINAIKSEIESNTNTLTKNISLASQVYGCMLTKMDKKDTFKDKNSYMKKILQRSSTQHRVPSQYRPSSPELRETRQSELSVETIKVRGMSNSSSCGFIQKPERTGSEKNNKPIKIRHSKTVHKMNQKNNDIVLKIKTKIKSKTQLLPFYVLLYEAYTICLLKINSQLKKKFYRQGREELKDKIVREYPGRNIEQVLFQIELDKLKAYELKGQLKKSLIKVSSPSSMTLLKKAKILSSSASMGKLSLNSINPSAYKESSYAVSSEVQQSCSSSQLIENNSNILGLKMKSRKSHFGNQKDLKEKGQIVVDEKKNFSHKNADVQIKDVANERKQSFHFRTRIISSKSEHKSPINQIHDNCMQNIHSNAQIEKKELTRITSRTNIKDEKKNNIFERLKHGENREKLVLKKKAKQLIQEKNLLKLNQFNKTHQESERSGENNGEASKKEGELISQGQKVGQQGIVEVMMECTERKEDNKEVHQEKHVSLILIEQQQKPTEVDAEQQQHLAQSIKDQPNPQQSALRTVELIQTEETSQQPAIIPSSIQQQKNPEQQVQQNNSNDAPFQIDTKQQTQNNQFPSRQCQKEQAHLTEIVNKFLQGEMREKVVGQILEEEQIEKQQHQLLHFAQTKEQANQQTKEQAKQHLPQTIKQATKPLSGRSTFYYPLLGANNGQILPPTRDENGQASNRRIPLCDIQSQEVQHQKSEKKLKQSVYEIMIMDTPMNGHTLYSSTNRAKRIQQQVMPTNNNDIAKNAVQEQNGSQMMQGEESDVQFLHVPQLCSSTSEGEGLAGVKRVSDGEVKERQLQVRNNDDSNQQHHEEIQRYFSNLYTSIERQTNTTDPQQCRNDHTTSHSSEQPLVQFILQQEKIYNTNSIEQINQQENDYNKKVIPPPSLQGQQIAPWNGNVQTQQQSPPAQQLTQTLFVLDKQQPQQNQLYQQTPEYMNTYSSSQQQQQPQCKSSTSIREIKQQLPVQSQHLHQPQLRRNNVSFAQTTQILNHNSVSYIITSKQDSIPPQNTNNKTDQNLVVDNNITSLLNATNIQYSQTSKINITEYSPIISQSNTGKQYAMKQKKRESSIIVHEGEDILDLRTNRQEKSIGEDVGDEHVEMKTKFDNQSHILSYNVSIDSKKFITDNSKKSIILKSKISSKSNFSQNKLNNSRQEQKKNNIQIPFLPRQQTIESNRSSNQQAHTIIISHHVLKPQIFVSQTLVRLIVYHPQAKQTCQVEKQFQQPINVKDYMKGLQARIIKFLDKLITQAKQHQKERTNSTYINPHVLKRSISINSQSVKRSKRQSIIVNDLINHGQISSPLNWQYIVYHIGQIDLEQQLWNLKTLLVPYNKSQYLTLCLMHYADYGRLIIEFKKNPLQLRPVEISMDLNQSINEIISLFNQNNSQVAIELNHVGNEIRPILQVYNLWCQLETLAISLKNSSAKIKSLFKLNQFAFKSSENATKYNMLIQMIHNDNEMENLVISDINLNDRNNLANNFSVVVGYAVKIEKGRAKFIVGGKQVKFFLNML